MLDEKLTVLYFTRPAEMQETLGSPEGNALASYMSNFATRGAAVIDGVIEN